MCAGVDAEKQVTLVGLECGQLRVRPIEALVFRHRRKRFLARYESLMGSGHLDRRRHSRTANRPKLLRLRRPNRNNAHQKD
jgi:hypothetical protein